MSSTDLWSDERSEKDKFQAKIAEVSVIFKLHNFL